MLISSSLIIAQTTVIYYAAQVIYPYDFIYISIKNKPGYRLIVFSMTEFLLRKKKSQNQKLENINP